MSRDAFSANVKFGGLLNQDEIKILICYLVSTVKEGLSKDDIVSVINNNKIANYFEIVKAFVDLEKDEHIKPYARDNNEELYISTETGKMISNQLDSMLPLSIREKVISSSITLLARKKSEKENIVSIEPIEDGFHVNCTIPGASTSLLELSMYVPDSMQAKKVQENFLKNTELIYSVLLSFFSEDLELLNSNMEKIKKQILERNLKASGKN